MASLRDIVEIDEALCDGCGVCVPSCAEGALAVVDGKLRIVDDARCDGMGACLGNCPKGALRVIKREAVAFDESYADPAHSSHPAPAPCPPKPAMRVLQDAPHAAGGGCPGSRSMAFAPKTAVPGTAVGPQPSSLQQWPVQLHLVHPAAPFWNGKELLLAADCVPFAMGSFHRDLLSDRAVAIACPKLDDPSGYLDKLTAILANNDVKALRVAIMEVPCCGGLAQLALKAVEQSQFKNDVEIIVVSRFGEIIQKRSIQRAQPLCAE